MPLEKTDELWARAACKQRGMFLIKLSLLIGIPDRLLLAPGGRVAFLEFKTPAGSLSKMQVWWRRKLQDMDFLAACIDDRAELLKILDKLEG